VLQTLGEALALLLLLAQCGRLSAHTRELGILLPNDTAPISGENTHLLSNRVLASCESRCV
jgi:hypothetical protein